MTTAHRLLNLRFPTLDAQSQEFQKTEINWPILADKSRLTSEETDILIDFANRENWKSIRETKNIAKYVGVVLSTLEIIEDDFVFTVVVSVIYDFISFVEESQKNNILKYVREESYKALGNKLTNGDEKCSCHTARLYVVLSLADEKKLPESECLINWVENAIERYPEYEQRCTIALYLLGHLLKIDIYRVLFSGRYESFRCICKNIIHSKNSQIQYHALFIVWILSFDTSSAILMQREFGTITELLNICKSSNKEKIPRLCIGTWRNFLNVCPKIAIPVMIGARIFQFLDSSSVKKISDEEVLTDIGVLKEKLNIAIQNLNSLDEYVSELQSGILTWSPPHQSDLFWKENASRLEANDYEILRILTSMLEFDNDPQILAIVANDIGMYVTHHPAGRKSLEILGTKSRIMALFYHSDAEVRYQALSAMQKYMKNMWHTK